jgi:hypothetical protein
VQIPLGITLEPDRPFDVLVTVKSVHAPGHYKGKLQFRAEPRAKPVEISLELRVTARPDLKLLPSNPAFKVVRCSIVCKFVDFAFPAVSRGDQLELDLDNVTLSDFDVKTSKSQLVLHGEKRGESVSPGQIAITWPSKLSSQQRTAIKMKINRAELPADRYQGSIRLGLNDSDALIDEVSSVPVTVDVRNGVVWVAVIILFGIIIGRIVNRPQQPAPTGFSLAFLAGTNVSDAANQPRLRPFLFLLLLLLLTLIGIKTLYLDMPTFGHKDLRITLVYSFGASALTSLSGHFRTYPSQSAKSPWHNSSLS